MNIRTFLPLILLVALLTGQEAQACTQVPTGLFLLTNSTHVPVDGAWAASTICRECSSLPLAVNVLVTDEDGQEISGQVTANVLEYSGYISWVPDDLLTVGETYAIEFLNENLSFDQPAVSFVAVPSLGVTAPSLTPQIQLTDAWSFEGKSTCCEGLSDSCGPYCSVVPEQGTRSVGVLLDFSLAAQDALLYQFLYRTVMVDNGEEFVIQDSTIDGAASRTFTGAARPVCFEITAHHIKTGDETTFFDDCVDLGEAPQTPEEEAKTSALRYGLGSCVDPGEFEAEWCEIFSEPLRTGSCAGYRSNACIAALDTCPAPANTPSSENPDAAAEEPSDGDDKAQKVAKKNGKASGCSIDPPRKGSAPPYSLLLLAGAVTFLLRRRLLSSNICSTRA